MTTTPSRPTLLVSTLLRGVVRRVTSLTGQEATTALRIEVARAGYLGLASPDALTQLGREAAELLALANDDAANALALAEHREALRAEEFEAWKAASLARVNAAVAAVRVSERRAA